MREHPSLGPYVEDLLKLAITSYADMERLMAEGNKLRTIAATNMNEQSSRSHAIFSITLTNTLHDVDVNTQRVSRISLVDLAGSEKLSLSTSNERFKEGAEINLSLSTLGRVISALAERSERKSKRLSEIIVPYRDSTLTWILKDSLGGNSKTAMLATLSPADLQFEETLSTLRYATRVKRIKTRPVVNEDANVKFIRELKQELLALRAQLAGSSDAGPTKAELLEKLMESEKLMLEASRSWEERLAKAREIQNHRDAALESLGISVDENQIGLHMPKYPHLVNVSDDPLLNTCLIYNIRPGVTEVGNETSENVQIRLGGTGILPRHCRFEYYKGQIQVTPIIGASVVVNRQSITTPTDLHTGDRLLLGAHHTFRFTNPEEAFSPAQIDDHAVATSILNRNADLDSISDDEVDRLLKSLKYVQRSRQSRTGSPADGNKFESRLQLFESPTRSGHSMSKSPSSSDLQTESRQSVESDSVFSEAKSGRYNSLEEEHFLIQKYVHIWRSVRWVAMQFEMAKNKQLMKQAQVYLNRMGRRAVLQFCIMDPIFSRLSRREPTKGSPTTNRPHVGARLVDFQHSSITMLEFSELSSFVSAILEILSPGRLPSNERTEEHYFALNRRKYSLLGVTSLSTKSSNFTSSSFISDVYSPYTFQVIAVFQVVVDQIASDTLSLTIQHVSGLTNYDACSIHLQVASNGQTNVSNLYEASGGRINLNESFIVKIEEDKPLLIQIFGEVRPSFLESILSWDTLCALNLSSTQHAMEVPLASAFEISELGSDGLYTRCLVQSVNGNPCFCLTQGLQRQISLNISHFAPLLSDCEIDGASISNIAVHTGAVEQMLSRIDEIEELRILNSSMLRTTDGRFILQTKLVWTASGFSCADAFDRTTGENNRISAEIHFHLRSAHLGSLLIPFHIYFRVIPTPKRKALSRQRDASIFVCQEYSVRLLYSSSLQLSTSSYTFGEETLFDWTLREEDLIQDYRRMLKTLQSQVDLQAWNLQNPKLSMRSHYDRNEMLTHCLKLWRKKFYDVSATEKLS